MVRTSRAVVLILEWGGMARLGKAERAFCLYHGIPLERLFNASGIRASEYRETMKAEEKWAAYGVTPCASGSHILRNRHGTCLMCKTERVAYLLRTKLPGYLYVASGAGGRLMKLGFSQNPVNRIAIANYEGWGGYYDWSLRVYCWNQEAGHLESELHAAFAPFSVALEWERNGRFVVTKEAYLSDTAEALLIIGRLCDDVPEIVPPAWD